MKIRIGFVSNSSSSSFLIYGCNFLEEMEEKGVPTPGLDIFYGDPNDSPREYFVGLSWDKVKDNETGKEFKTRVENLIRNVLGDQYEGCGTIEECYYDG